MSEEIDLNASVETANCLVRKTGFGEDVVTNICSGEITRVPWEIGDWFSLLMVSCLAALVFGVIAGLVWVIRSDLR